MMASMSVPILFDQQLIRQHRQRAAPSYADFAFLKDAAAALVGDVIEAVGSVKASDGDVKKAVDNVAAE